MSHFLQRFQLPLANRRRRLCLAPRNELCKIRLLLPGGWKPCRCWHARLAKSDFANSGVAQTHTRKRGNTQR
jgi:hypothetical protein